MFFMQYKFYMFMFYYLQYICGISSEQEIFTDGLYGNCKAVDENMNLYNLNIVGGLPKLLYIYIYLFKITNTAGKRIAEPTMRAAKSPPSVDKFMKYKSNSL